MFGFYQGNVEEQLPLSTLAANDLIAVNFDESTNHSALLTSLKATFSISGFTAGEGPIIVGIAMGDYTDAEIEAFVELTAGSWGVVDLVQREIANRLIRRIGAFDSQKTGDVLNLGRPIKTRLNWRIPEGETLKLWAYNQNAAPLTTGAIVRCDGHVNLKNIP